MAGGGGAEDGAGDRLALDGTLGDFNWPAEDAERTNDDVKDLAEPVTTVDANVSDDAKDSADLANPGEDAPDALTGSGGVGGGGSGGTVGVEADCASEGGGGRDNGGAGGSGGTGGAGEVDAECGGGSGDAVVDSSGGSGDTDGSEDANNGTGTGGVGGTGGIGTGGVVGTGGAGFDPDLVLWYKFDDTSGTIAADSSLAGGTTHDGTLGTTGAGGSATNTTDCQVGTHALSLAPSSRGSTPAGGYVTMPAPEALAPGALTIALWVKLTAATANENWERIFDFGNGSTANAYLYLTARASDATTIPLRFGISNTGHTTAAEQRLESPTALTPSVWHHIAIVLPTGATYTGSLYLDGVPVATNKAMTLHMSDVGATTLNWLGRSPFAADPLFNGSFDDFRIYKRGLSATEISALFTLR